jgi:hypothetical protein
MEVPENLDLLKFRREAIYKEITYRRERRWQILSWASSLFVAAIGGTVAIQRGDNPFGKPLRILLSMAMGFLCVISIVWTYQETTALYERRDRLRSADAELGLPTLKSSTTHLYGYQVTLALFGAAAVLAIWLPY